MLTASLEKHRNVEAQIAVGSNPIYQKIWTSGRERNAERPTGMALGLFLGDFGSRALFAP